MFYPIGAYQMYICIYLLVICFTVSLTILYVSFSLSLSFTVPFPLTHFLSEVHSPHANGQPPPPHVYLIKNQLKTPRRRVSRAKPRLRVEQKRFPHSLDHSLTLVLSLLLSAFPSLFLVWSLSLPPKLRPPVYWKLAT